MTHAPDSRATIAASARRFSLGTFLSRLTGFAREVGMAAAFGATPEVAAFWMAFRFAHLLRRLFGEGGLHVAFVPHFETLNRENPQKGAAFFYRLFFSLSFFLLLLTLVVEALLGCLLIYAPLEASTANVMRLTMIMLPVLIFICLYALSSSFLNCKRVYFLPSAAPAALNLIWIAALAFLWRKPQEVAIEQLAMIVVFAFAVQWLATLPMTYQTLNQGFRSNAVARGELWALLKPVGLALVGVGAVQFNTAVDTLFARSADPSGPAILWYAIRLQQVPLALVGVGLTGALLPPITRALQAGEVEKARDFLHYATQKAVLFLVPLTAALVALGREGVALVYERGAFTHADTVATCNCLFAYGAGLVPMTLVLIGASPFYALKNYRTPALLSIVTVGCNVALNALFVFVLKLGTVGIALATTVAACLNAALLFHFLAKAVGKLPKVAWMKVSLLSLAGCAVAYWIPSGTTLLGHLGSFAAKGCVLASFGALGIRRRQEY